MSGIVANTLVGAYTCLLQGIKEFMEETVVRFLVGDLLLILAICILKLLYYWLDDVKKKAIYRIVASMGDKIEKE
jgi:hypothetical protein